MWIPEREVAPVDARAGAVFGLEPLVGGLEVPAVEESFVGAERGGVL